MTELNEDALREIDRKLDFALQGQTSAEVGERWDLAVKGCGEMPPDIRVKTTKILDLYFDLLKREAGQPDPAPGVQESVEDAEVQRYGKENLPAPE